ncbi:SIR2 family NAD-dependent protein deacylase [Allonocardiopsis opalescens]|uniref:SIR2-like protein n=1 Tax=Allonocardiopsis opalescens TaxID=1144618 RepID=A0A2T0Q9Q5_9ACTN|nr:SIR2 family protein [Allonocardiopsis opalescens]PRY00542.1 SIR2-like protein [Allonocardiopsis opalescens]
MDEISGFGAVPVVHTCPREIGVTMARFAESLDDGDWKRLLKQLGNGDCTPFLGAGASHPVLPLGGDIAALWAAEYGYPFPDDRDLPRVAQFVSTRVRDDQVVKEQLIARFFTGVPAPDFGAADSVHGLLAQFPLGTYLTTNYDDLMQRALAGRGKAPTTSFSRWYAVSDDELADERDEAADRPGLLLPEELVPAAVRQHERVGVTPSDYRPAPDRPLVFHLHGHAERPLSLVLTEDDYLDYLVALVQDHPAVAPGPVRKRLGAKPLLFVGYSLADWSFRVLYHSIRLAISRQSRRRHISVQVDPAVRDADDPAQVEAARQYVTRHFDQRDISLYLGTAQQFAAELRLRMEDPT